MRERAIRFAVAGVFPAAMITVAAAIASSNYGFTQTEVDFRSLGLTTLVSGIASMALIETVKRMVPIRAAFQRHQASLFARDLDIDWTSLSKYEDSRAERLHSEVSKALHTLEKTRLARGIDSAFNLPAEQFVAQLGLLIESDRPPHSQRDSDLPPLDEAGLGSTLDRMQIKISSRWRHYVQASAIWLSGWLALLWSVLDDGSEPGLQVLAALAFGGFFAWLFRDIAAAIESWRR